MILKAKYTTLFLFLGSCLFLNAQSDSISRLPSLTIQLKNDSNVVFENKKLQIEHNDEPNLEIGAYLSSYYAYYTEDNSSDYVKHATMAARNQQFGLNMAMISMKYQSQKFRNNICLHYGDIAESTWPSKFNLIQEANAGVELIKHLWLDAGIFRSHIGLESTQPRENITSSMSLANVYEPYFFSGAKLTYCIKPNLSIQIQSFNGFNSIVETNKNKLLGTSIVFAPNQYLTLTYNFITGDDTMDSIKLKHQRYYHNSYLNYQKNKWTIGAELNYGWQKNSKKIDEHTYSTANMNSSLIVIKHQTLKKLAFYGRLEWFSDKNEILSYGSKMGTYTWGATAGIEYKPFKTIALSFESRQLRSEKANFLYNGNYSSQRSEFIFCMDAWF
jgi:hypothetical protein